MHDGKKSVRQFALKDPVYTENFTNKKPKWLPGTVAKITGPLSYVIELRNGMTVRRHVDSIRKRVQTRNKTLIQKCKDQN